MGALIAQEIPDEISLLDAVTVFLNRTPANELQRVLQTWIERLENVITAEGATHPSE
jgi:hypothetical protein